MHHQWHFFTNKKEGSKWLMIITIIMITIWLQDDYNVARLTRTLDSSVMAGIWVNYNCHMFSPLSLSYMLQIRNFSSGGWQIRSAWMIALSLPANLTKAARNNSFYMTVKICSRLANWQGPLLFLNKQTWLHPCRNRRNHVHLCTS